MDVVRDTSPIFNQLLLRAKKLEDVVSLSSGLGLHDIWFAFLHERRSEIFRDAELESLSSFCDNNVSDFGASHVIINGGSSNI
jgi:hypothetical protein